MECFVDHDINLSPMVPADHELLRVSFSYLPSQSRFSGWVLGDPANLCRFQWPLKDFVFDPQGNIELEVSRWTCAVQTSQRHGSHGFLSILGRSSDKQRRVVLSCAVGNIGLSCSRQMFGFRCGACPPHFASPPFSSLRFSPALSLFVASSSFQSGSL